MGCVRERWWWRGTWGWVDDVAASSRNENRRAKVEKNISKEQRGIVFGALLLLSVHDYTGVGTRSVLNRLSPVQGKYRPINCEYIWFF